MARDEEILRVRSHLFTPRVDLQSIPVRTYNLRAASGVATAAILVVSAAWVGFAGLGWEISLSARDPLAVARAGDDVDQPYVGWVSNLGVIGWGVGAVAATFAAQVTLVRGDRSESAFLLVGGVLALLLMLDDLYQLHEYVLPRYVPGPRDSLILVWAAYAVTWACLFRRRLWREPDLPLLTAAGVGFGLSLGFERLEVVGYYEEGAKLVGIICFAAFHWRVAKRAVLLGA